MIILMEKKLEFYIEIMLSNDKYNLLTFAIIVLFNESGK